MKCLVCGTPLPHNATKPAKFCSSACRKSAERIRRQSRSTEQDRLIALAQKLLIHLRDYNNGNPQAWQSLERCAADIAGLPSVSIGLVANSAHPRAGESLAPGAGGEVGGE